MTDIFFVKQVAVYFFTILPYHKNMALITTTIGSYPIPKSVPITNWFQSKDLDPEEATRQYTDFLENTDSEVEKHVRAGIREVWQSASRTNSS